MRQERGFILNIVAIIVVLCIIYFSQYRGDPNLRMPSESMNIFSKFSVELQKRGEELTKQANTAKNNIAQNIFEGIKNYFAQKFNYIFKTDVK